MRVEHQFIIDLLESGKQLVTASRRQARFIQSLWQSHQQKKTTGLSWEQANCIAWNEWLQQKFEITTLYVSLQQHTVPKLLSSLEQRWLWQGLLSEYAAQQPSLATKALNQQQSLLSSLLQAWTHFNEWQLEKCSKQMQLFSVTEETRLFRTLVKKFQQQCELNNWLSKEILVDFIADNFSLWSAHAPAKLCFYGFDVWTPQQQSFLNKIDTLDVIDFKQIDFKQPPAVEMEHQQSLHPCASKYAEWQQAAIWARTQSEENSAAQIAVVIPSLANETPAILRVFQEVFQPQLQLKAEAVVAAGFNISVGEDIQQQPIIYSARRWFSLVNGASGEVWKQAFNDKFCTGANQERWARAVIAVHTELNSNTFYNPEMILKILSKGDMIPLKKWFEILHTLKQTGESFTTKNTPAQWCEGLEQLLTNLGWPGSSTLTSRTFQAKNQWLEQFRQLAALGGLCGKLRFNQFLKLLDEQLNNSKFQPETPAARVQVLGVLEAIALSFDSLWLCGCQDTVFPAPLHASPWLPISLQQQLQMPGASSVREQKFAARLFSGMKKNCSDLHYSFALTERDAELKPSAFLAHLQAANKSSEMAAEQLPGYWQKQVDEAASFVYSWRDTQGEKLSSANVRSGVGILKSQASCPFKAYAEYRLSAAAKREPGIGIDPIQRGNWVHDSLEMLWRRLATQQALLELDQQELQTLVENCVKEVIYNPSVKGTEAQSPLVRLEYQRTVKLLLTWLEVDRSRPEFFKVAVEQSQNVSIASLNFMVRADRIDDVTGGKVIIDYKTGKISTTSWFKERITEPQLPLYGLLFNDDLCAIAFAQINTADCKLSGWGDEDLDIKGIKAVEDWPLTLEQWKIKLETVALEFSEGYAAVDPDIEACKFCEFPHLCRRDAYFEENPALKKSLNDSGVSP